MNNDIISTQKNLKFCHYLTVLNFFTLLILNSRLFYVVLRTFSFLKIINFLFRWVVAQ